MQVASNWRESNGGGHDVPTGGYVCRIMDVFDDASREKLIITYDIAEGPNAGIFADEWSISNDWAHQVYQSYKETAFGLFRNFVESIEKSNPGFTWDNQNEKLFVGKVVGIILKHEEKKDHTQRLSKICEFCTVDEIRANSYKMPTDVPYEQTWAGKQEAQKAANTAAAPVYNPQPVQTQIPTGGNANYNAAAGETPYTFDPSRM